MVEAQFECIMAFKQKNLTDVNLERVFSVLDNDNDGRIDGLELLGGLSLISQGSFEDKAKFCFELYDFNLNASLSKCEMVMMMQSAICGMLCLAGAPEEAEPLLSEFEHLAEEAFLRADQDRSNQITYNEF